MAKRNQLYIDLLCFGSALVLAIFGIGAARGMPVAAGAGFWLGAVLLIVAGLFARGRYWEAAKELEREHSRAEVLSVQVQQQRQAVDILADGLEIAIFICDRKAVIQYANRKAIEMFRFPNAVERSVLAVTLSYDLESLVGECFRSKEKQHAELTFPYPNERVAVAEAWLEPGGERLFLSLYEITDLRRLERVRQDFVANVSHELRTPLSTIRAMAETLLDEDEPKTDLQARYLNKVVDEVDRLSLIANDLLVLSAAESNPVRRQTCNIAEVFRTIIGQLQRKAEEKGLNLSYHGPQEALIQANTAQMGQVATNLVDNAINYTVQGSVQVSLEQQEGEVLIQVKDTGIGIPSEHQPRIFERFYRVDKGRSRATGGTGLGLSIVKHIVESHGGSVSVESALNQGSTFAVRLPVGNLSLETPNEGST